MLLQDFVLPLIECLPLGQEQPWQRAPFNNFKKENSALTNMHLCLIADIMQRHYRLQFIDFP